MSSQLVDLHCHILPGIDDGAKNLDVSMSLIQKEMEDGVVGIVFTPHFHYERITLDAFVQQRKMAYRSVVAQLAERKLPLAVKLGAEVYFTTALASLDLSKLAFAGSRYILIEFPTSIHPGGIEDTLFAVQNRGYTPILAHVERYRCLESRGLLEKLKARYPVLPRILPCCTAGSAPAHWRRSMLRVWCAVDIRPNGCTNCWIGT